MADVINSNRDITNVKSEIFNFYPYKISNNLKLKFALNHGDIIYSVLSFFHLYKAMISALINLQKSNKN